MKAKEKAKLSWQQIAGIVLAVPMIFIPIDYYGYGMEGKPMHLQLGPIWGTILCMVSGILAGLMFHAMNQSFKIHLVMRMIAGAVTGATAIWAFGAYLYLRGFPKEIYEFELILAGFLAVIPGLIIYRVFVPRQTGVAK